MDEFEKWYNEQYPLPPTIERGPIGRDAKEQARSAWKAAISAENSQLRDQLAEAEGKGKDKRQLLIVRPRQTGKTMDMIKSLRPEVHIQESDCMKKLAEAKKEAHLLKHIPRCPCLGVLEGLGIDIKTKEVVYQCNKCHHQMIVKIKPDSPQSQPKATGDKT